MEEAERAEVERARPTARAVGAKNAPSRAIPFGDLEARAQERLAAILNEQVPEVFRANRVIEQQTGYSSEIGKNMLVDVLSHLGTLAHHGGRLTPEQQASQLTKIEEHLRRALIEHPEEVLRNRIVDVEERWLVYQRQAFPYREQGTLPNAPRHQELEEVRQRIHVLLEAARRKKPDETTWDETLTAAAEMTEAAALTRDLADKLEQCIGAAQERRRQEEEQQRQAARHRGNMWRWGVGIAVAIALAVGGYVTGRSSADNDREGQPRPQPSLPNALPER